MDAFFGGFVAGVELRSMTHCGGGGGGADMVVSRTQRAGCWAGMRALVVKREVWRCRRGVERLSGPTRRPPWRSHAPFRTNPRTCERLKTFNSHNSHRSRLQNSRCCPSRRLFCPPDMRNAVFAG